jgi:hypothetical protein
MMTRMMPGKTIRALLLMGLGVLAGHSPAWGSVTGVAPELRLDAGNHRIKFSINFSPDVADWNSDGKKDFVIAATDPALFGTSPTTAVILVYLNVGTDEHPVLEEYSTVESGGGRIEIFTYS